MSSKLIGVALAATVVMVAGPVSAGDLDGAYVGATGNIGVNAPFVPDVEYGAFAGYNFDLGSGMIVGGEADVAYNSNSLWGFDAITAKASGRAGYEVADNVMLYGKAGLGYTTGAAGSAVWSAGAGADIAVMENILLRTEIERVDPFAAGMMTQYNGKVGVGYNF